MSRVEDCTSAALKGAKRGADTESILDEILVGLGEELRPFTFIAVLRAAFGVPVQTLRAVENWNRLEEHGDMTTLEVASLLHRWIDASRIGYQ